MSRREALFAALAAPSLGCAMGAFACDSGTPPPVQTQPTGASAERPPLKLDVVNSGRMREDERGGSLVVLLHGWAARGDDLLPLAQALARPRTRFVLPAGPLPEGPSGRAWWRIAEQRPQHAWEDILPANHQPNPQLRAAREAIQSLLTNLQQRYAPESLALVGFSQGAMLALDVALSGKPTIARVAVLSGALLTDSVPALRAHHTPPPAAFLAHGREDPVVPFRASERARHLLQQHGIQVHFHPFEGGHTIPPAIVTDLETFLFPT